MSDHTKGTWRVSIGDSVRRESSIVESSVEIWCEFERIADCNVSKAIGFPTKKANARRIVACVNACAGMDDPEAYITLIESNANDASKYQQQRDELLSAMKKIRPFIDEGEVPQCFWSEPFKSAVADFDAAIEKAK